MSKQSKNIMASLFLIACLAAACKQSTGTGPAIVESYPLATGNLWEYSREFYIFNFRPIQPGATIPRDTFRSAIRVEILGQRILRDSIMTWEFKIVQNVGGATYTGYYFYRPVLDSLFLYARTGVGGSIIPVPQLPQTLTIEFRGKTYASLWEFLSSLHLENFPLAPAIVDTFYEEHPPKSLVFPLRVGNEWTYRQRGYPWRMDRKVIDFVFLQTPVGQQPAYRIRWFWDTDDNGQWDNDIEGYDYVSNLGVLSGTFECRNLIAIDANNQRIGYFDVRDEYNAVSISIHLPY